MPGVQNGNRGVATTKPGYLPQARLPVSLKHEIATANKRHGDRKNGGVEIGNNSG